MIWVVEVPGLVVAVHGHGLIVVAHGQHESSCDQIEPGSPTLPGGFLTTGPLGNLVECSIEPHTLLVPSDSSHCHSLLVYC